MKRSNAIPEWVVVLAIVLLAATLRVVWITQYPYGLNQDEAERGYEAYSLLRTGKDMHGHSWPLTLEAFSDKRDHSTAIPAYAAIPFTAWLGPGVAAARLPSAVVGTLTVLLTYAVARAWSQRRSVAVLAAITLAVSPWHLLLSRYAQESVWMPFFFLGGLLAFIHGRKRPWLYCIAAGVWAVGMYGYATAKLFEPLAILALAVLYWRDLRRHWRWVVLAAAVGLFVLIPLFQQNLIGLALGRYHEVNVQATSSNAVSAFLLNLLMYVTPFKWVGGKLGTGPLDWSVVLLGIPFFFILVRKTTTFLRPRVTLVVLFMVAIIVPSLTDGNPHPLRASTLIGLYSIAGAWGLVAFADVLRQHVKNFYFIIISCAAIIVFSSVGIHAFFKPGYVGNHQFIKIDMNFIPEVDTLVHTLQRNYASVPEVRIVMEYLNQPQIFFQLFVPWDPTKLGQDQVYGYCSGEWYANGNGPREFCIHGYCTHLMLCADSWYRTSRIGRYTFCDLPKCDTNAPPGTVYAHIARQRVFGTETLQTIPIRNVVGFSWIISR